MRSASFAARSCSGALLLLLVLTLPGLSRGAADPPDLAVAPVITTTTPAHDAMNASLTGTIQVWFSEPMDPATLNVTPSPARALTASWPQADLLNLTPDPPGLVNCTMYSIWIRANNTLAEPLVVGPVPNPWRFMTACDRPYVVSTVPEDGAQNVVPTADVVVTFSEPMDCLTVDITFSPPNLTAPGTSLTGCDFGGTVWTFRFRDTTSFLTNTTYTATVIGQSNDTHDDLWPSPTPNPWTFRVNAPPAGSVPTLSATGCLDAGTQVTVSWSMWDDTDAPTALSVRILFLNGSGWEPIFGPSTGFPSPAAYVWTLPPLDIDTNVGIEVTDTAGAVAFGWSARFRIDQGPPTVLAAAPSGTTGVSTDANLTIAFSEPMNTTSVEGAISSSPTFFGPVRFEWNAGNDTVRIFPGTLRYSTTYVVRLARTATDTCAPGRPTTAEYSFQFTTEPAPPEAPRRVFTEAYDDTSVTLRWDPVIRYITGDDIVPPAQVTYLVYRGNETERGTFLRETADTVFRDTGLRPRTPYWYRVYAVVNDTESPQGGPLRVDTLAPLLERPEGRLSVLAALAAVGVAAVIGAQMRRRRKKVEAEAALESEIEEIVDLVRKVRQEPNPEARRKQEAVLQQHFRVLVQGGVEADESFRADPRLEGLYRALAQALVRSPEVDVSRGRALVDRRLKDFGPKLRSLGSAYRLLSEAEASVQSELFPTLPESARKALLLVYFYGLEVYLSHRLRGLIPVGATVLLGERGHINVRRPGWEQQWAGLTLGNLLFVMDHNPHFFVADPERWQGEVGPLLHQAVEARNRTAHPSREAPPLDRVRDLVYGAIPAVESILKWPEGPVAG